MLPEKKKRLQEYAIMAGVGLFVLILLVVLVLYERARSRDALRLSTVSQLQASLQHYYQDHSAYPPSSTVPLALGSGIANCLGENGFNSYGSAPCVKKPYMPFIGRAPQDNSDDGYRYAPMDQTGNTCANEVACTDYSIDFYLETGVSGYSRGHHLMRPNGIQ